MTPRGQGYCSGVSPDWLVIQTLARTKQHSPMLHAENTMKQERIGIHMVKTPTSITEWMNKISHTHTQLELDKGIELKRQSNTSAFSLCSPPHHHHHSPGGNWAVLRALLIEGWSACRQQMRPELPATLAPGRMGLKCSRPGSGRQAGRAGQDVRWGSAWQGLCRPNDFLGLLAWLVFSFQAGQHCH